MSAHLYHGSATALEGPLRPVLRHGSEDHVHDRPAVFATERLDIASLFMVPSWTLSSIGVEQDIAYICIWGTREAFAPMDPGGFVHVLPREGFEKIGKDYEWQHFGEATPIETKRFTSVIDGMIDCGAQVYFIDDDPTFDHIVADKHDRAAILIDRESENARQGRGIKGFTRTH